MYLRRGAAAESCSAGGRPWARGAQRDAPISRARARSLNRGCAFSGTVRTGGPTLRYTNGKRSAFVQQLQKHRVRSHV